MRDIKLNNAGDVVDQLEKEGNANSDRNKSHTVLTEPRLTGEVDMDRVRQSMKNNAKFVVEHWHSKNYSSEEEAE